jgi:hypothetical protein
MEMVMVMVMVMVLATVRVLAIWVATVRVLATVDIQTHSYETVNLIKLPTYRANVTRNGICCYKYSNKYSSGRGYGHDTGNGYNRYPNALL